MQNWDAGCSGGSYGHSTMDTGCLGRSLWMQDRDVGCLGVGSQWIHHQRWEARGVSLWMQDNECGMLGEVPMDAAPGMADAQGSLWVHT